MNPIVIVGNGAGLLGKALGPIIDQHPIVVRLNRFQMEPAKDVGTRTTCHVFLDGIDPDPRAPIHIRAYQPGHRPRGGGGPEFILPSWVDDISGSLLGTSPPEWPSTGFRALVFFRMWVSRGEKISLVGFDSGCTGHYWDPGHSHGPGHPWRLEQVSLRTLQLQETTEVLDSPLLSNQGP
jgi:hypothetical protein